MFIRHDAVDVAGEGLQANILHGLQKLWKRAQSGSRLHGLP